MPTRIQLESTLLKAVSYDSQTALLEVELRDGAVYRYLVPTRIYDELLQAESKGWYFNRYIRNRFPTSKLVPAQNNSGDTTHFLK
jgi:hypothetical protein